MQEMYYGDVIYRLEWRLTCILGHIITTKRKHDETLAKKSGRASVIILILILLFRAPVSGKKGRTRSVPSSYYPDDVRRNNVYLRNITAIIITMDC